MDDFNITTLRECTNELCSRLMNLMTPIIMEGFRSLFEESWRMCIENNERKKYLMTFQNLLRRVPSWNESIIQTETKRILERSGCPYLEDLITCVHIVQLKTLTAIRVANKLKKIDISIPKLHNFIHRVYTSAARKLYTNVYLFERPATRGGGSGSGAKEGEAMPEMQKHNREIEFIINDCILNSVRESIPIEEILRAYLDENVEVQEEVVVEEAPPAENKSAAATDNFYHLSGSGSMGPTPDMDRSVFRTPSSDLPLTPSRTLAIEDAMDGPVRSSVTFRGYDTAIDRANNLQIVETHVNDGLSSGVSSAQSAATLAAARRIDDVLDSTTGPKVKVMEEPTPSLLSSVANSALAGQTNDFDLDIIDFDTPSKSSSSPATELSLDDLGIEVL